MTDAGAIAAALDRDGFVVVAGLLDSGEVDGLCDRLTSALGSTEDESVRRSENGHVFAARHVLAHFPEAVEVVRQHPIADLLGILLGPTCGVVRGLYFDKPPEHTWALPWHQDVTIAVREHLPTVRYEKPTREVGVSHVEAPAELLEQMLAVRIHLDDVTEANGPLRVVPGSHRHGKELWLGAEPRSVLGRRGDVLFMRPLLAHCSGKSRPDIDQHRRTLHLELASSPDLEDGFAWHEFFPVL
jgi:ectoine hydroxylase-related dioxygenase (phytanoyl-CoA dioxygenase family)